MQNSDAVVFGKYITFELDKQEYGIHIDNIREIIGMVPVTQVPKTPDFVQGFINIRDKVIPVLDLRKRMGLTAKDYDERTPIIIAELPEDHTQTHIGVIVDSVSEVVEGTDENISETPSFGIEVDTRFFSGVLRAEHQMTTLVNINEVLRDVEIDPELGDQVEA